MSVWDAMAQLDSLVDESDPDLDLPQIHHALQTAEALRADGQPRWLVLTGLLHDLGKLLCLFGEPQWAVVGDTFPVGCAFDARVVHADLFAENPDRAVSEYGTDPASIPRTADSTRSIFPGATTSTSTTCCASICPSRRST